MSRDFSFLLHIIPRWRTDIEVRFRVTQEATNELQQYPLTRTEKALSLSLSDRWQAATSGEANVKRKKIINSAALCSVGVQKWWKLLNWLLH